MIIAIITIYYPKLNHIDNIMRISDQVDKVIVCDNSDKDHFHLFTSNKNFYYVHFKKNMGLSKAFNSVLKNKEMNWEDDQYIIFFDQDSIIEEKYIDNIIDEYNLINSSCYEIGCLGPFFYNNSNNKIEYPKNKTKILEKSFIVDDIITSSLLTKYKDLKSIGFWNENLFLDMADWDLCWRFLQLNKICCMTDRVILNHTVGIGEKKINNLEMRISNPYREYYQIRDSLYLIFKKYVPLRGRLNLLAKIFIFPILHIIFFENKILRSKYIIRGIKDYFRGYHGEVTY